MFKEVEFLQFDRVLGTRMGAKAVELLYNGKSGIMVGIEKNEIITHPLKWPVQLKKS